MLIFNAMLMHIFGNLKQEAIQDKYDLNRQYVWRQKKKVNAAINTLLESARLKLGIEFEERKIINPDFSHG